MTQTDMPTIDPDLDLVLERVVAVPPRLVWKAWTQAEHLKHWFAPSPMTVADCEVDPRPGGIFKCVMRSPEGEVFDGAGCVLVAVPERRFVWTDALGPGYRPSKESFVSVRRITSQTGASRQASWG